MSKVSLPGRLCFGRGTPILLRPIPRRQPCFAQWTIRHSHKTHWRRPRTLTVTLFAASLSPAAFVKLSEEDHGDGKTGEEQMLEASREEIKKRIPESAHGLTRLWKTVLYTIDQYVYEPIATALRFIHLVVIFVPVIITIPAIWIGPRRSNHNNERAGTILWFQFLINSMERAGPAFIKVRLSPSLPSMTEHF